MTRATKTFREWMNRSVKIGQVLPAYVVLAVGGILGAWQFDTIATQRAGDAIALADQRASDLEARHMAELETLCETRVEVRITLRDVLLSIVAQFNQAEPGIQATIALIENEYPVFTVADCLSRFQVEVQEP